MLHDFLHVWDFLGYASNGLCSFALLEEEGACSFSLECNSFVFNVALVAGEESNGPLKILNVILRN
jgi:hypothetical protein